MATLQPIRTLNERSRNLYRDGYRVEKLASGEHFVTNAQGVTYLVDDAKQTCECASYQRGQYRDDAGNCTCKHVAGLGKLIVDQANAEFWAHINRKQTAERDRMANAYEYVESGSRYFQGAY